MRTAKIRVVQRSDEDILQKAAADFVTAWNGSAPSDLLVTFSSPAQLFSVMTSRRWDLLHTLQKDGPQTYRGLAAALNRDVKRVHDDAAALIEWGLVQRNENGRICVPFDLIHTEFDLKSAA